MHSWRHSSERLSVYVSGVGGAVDGGGLWTTAPVEREQPRCAPAARLTTALGKAQDGQSETGIPDGSARLTTPPHSPAADREPQNAESQMLGQEVRDPGAYGGAREFLYFSGCPGVRFSHRGPRRNDAAWMG